MEKHISNLLSRNNWADFDETLYEASETKAHYSLKKYDPGLTLTFFTAMSSNYGIYMENVTMVDSLEIIAPCDLEFGLYSKLNGLTNDYV